LLHELAVVVTVIFLIQQKESIMSNSKSNQSTPMTPSSAARIQGTQAKTNGGQTAKGSFGARAQTTAAKNSK